MASTQRMFSVSFTGQEKLAKNCRMLREKFPEWLGEANQQTADEIFDEARRNIKQADSYATGELYDSVIVEVSARGLAIWVGSTSHYAPYVEFGTRPHFPPVDAIREWCRVRGIPESAAFPIARQISERGTPAVPFLYPALLKGKRDHLARIRKLISMAIKGVLPKAA
jgi:HK97 gp10 family phage protein